MSEEIKNDETVYEKVCQLCDFPFETEFETVLICEDCKEDFMKWKQECECKRVTRRMVEPSKPQS